MRRWLLFVLVLLLSLRGLVGDAMAGQMMAQHAAAVAAPAAGDLRAPAAAMASMDCDSHGGTHVLPAPPEATPGTAASSGDGAQAPEDCPTCASCQVCSSPAMSPAIAAALALPPAHVQPQQARDGHPSAEPALAFKPPRG